MNKLLDHVKGRLLVHKAAQFAKNKHNKHAKTESGYQARKYTGEPYWHHTHAVSNIVKQHGGSYEAQAAAHLHDTLEDTHTTDHELKKHFGPHVAHLVDQVTDRSSKLHKIKDSYYDHKGAKVNRAARKHMDLEHLKQSDHEGATIKLADILHNAADIHKHDKNFHKVFHAEKEKMIPHLAHGNKALYDKVVKQHHDNSKK